MPQPQLVLPKADYLKRLLALAEYKYGPTSLFEKLLNFVGKPRYSSERKASASFC
jgi:hypothetical protein